MTAVPSIAPLSGHGTCNRQCSSFTVNYTVGYVL